MKRYFQKIFFGTLLALAYSAPAQSQKAALPQAHTALHANRLRVNEIFPGLIFWQTRPGPNGGKTWVDGMPPFQVDYDGSPKPSAGLESAGLWLGALDSAGQVRVSGARYPWVEYSFTTGPLTGDWPADSLGSLRWDRFFRVDRAELEAHRADWFDNGVLDAPLPAITGWPGRGNPHFEKQYGFPLPDGDLAPFVDWNGDGMYNAYDGDYPHPSGLNPDVLPGEIIWNVFNDAYGNFLDVPLGVEIHQSAWALTCDDSLLNETIFISFRIINRSGAALDSTVAGLWMLPLIGDQYDDAFGTSVAQNSMFLYGMDNTDTTSHYSWNGKYTFGENPPAFSFTSLNRPLHTSTYHYEIVLCSPPPEWRNPYYPLEVFRNLNGYWKYGTPQTFGGNGYDYLNIGNPPARFIFPGDPNDAGSWSQIHNVGFFSCPQDVAVLPSILIGRLEPGASATLDFAFSYHRGAGLNHLQNVSYLYDRVDELQQLYDQQFTGACSYATCVEDCVWPGDTNRDGIVDHLDLLPLGVGWDTENGPVRSGLCTWAPHDAPDWDISFDGKYDYKHLDANGDGRMDSLDRQVLYNFLGLQTPEYVSPPDSFPKGPEVIVYHAGLPAVEPNNIKPENTVIVRVRPLNPSEVYGMAFTAVYDSAYWEIMPANSSIAMQSPLRFIQHKPGEVTFAAIFTDKKSNFKDKNVWFNSALRAKSISDTLPDSTFIRLKNIRGIRANGSEIIMGANALRYCFGAGCPSIIPTHEIREPVIQYFPNPASDRLTIQSPGMQWSNLEVFDTSGRLLRQWNEPGQDEMLLDLSGLPPGWMVLRLQGEGGFAQMRVYKGL